MTTRKSEMKGNLKFLVWNNAQVVQILRAESSSGQTELKQKSLGGKAIIVDACDLEDYTCTNYLNDLNRHMQLVLE